MAWNSDPKIRELAPYAKKHGYAMVVVYAVHDGGEQFTVTTYGKTKQLCKAASIAGEQLFELVKSGTYPDWPESEPK